MEWQCRLRRATEQDVSALEEMFARTTPRTVWLRYLTGRPLTGEFARSEALRLTQSERPGRITMLATAAVEGKTEVVGVGELAPDPRLAGVGEIAIMVQDDHQRRGVGSELLRRLASLAEARGIRRVRAVMLAENLAARRLMARLGRPLDVELYSGTLEMLYDLGPVPPEPLRAGDLGAAS